MLQDLLFAVQVVQQDSWFPLFWSPSLTSALILCLFSQFSFLLPHRTWSYVQQHNLRQCKSQLTRQRQHSCFRNSESRETVYRIQRILERKKIVKNGGRRWSNGELFSHFLFLQKFSSEIFENSCGRNGRDVRKNLDKTSYAFSVLCFCFLVFLMLFFWFLWFLWFLLNCQFVSCCVARNSCAKSYDSFILVVVRVQVMLSQTTCILLVFLILIVLFVFLLRETTETEKANHASYSFFSSRDLLYTCDSRDNTERNNKSTKCAQNNNKEICAEYTRLSLYRRQWFPCSSCCVGDQLKNEAKTQTEGINWKDYRKKGI